MSWGKGQDVIEDLLTRGHLEQVPANPDEAQYLLVRSRVHLDTAAAMVDADPEIAYDALYAAARKALTAVLRQQGLRPTTTCDDRPPVVPPPPPSPRVTGWSSRRRPGAGRHCLRHEGDPVIQQGPGSGHGRADAVVRSPRCSRRQAGH